MIDISGLDKAEVLKALYDGSHPQGLSFLGVPATGVTLAVCRDEVARKVEGGHDLRFDYWHGHVLKVDITGDEFDPWLYDRDCGTGAAERAISLLRERVAA